MRTRSNCLPSACPPTAASASIAASTPSATKTPPNTAAISVAAPPRSTASAPQTASGTAGRRAILTAGVPSWSTPAPGPSRPPGPRPASGAGSSSEWRGDGMAAAGRAAEQRRHGAFEPVRLVEQQPRPLRVCGGLRSSEDAAGDLAHDLEPRIARHRHLRRRREPRIGLPGERPGEDGIRAGEAGSAERAPGHDDRPRRSAGPDREGAGRPALVVTDVHRSAAEQLAYPGRVERGRIDPGAAADAALVADVPHQAFGPGEQEFDVGAAEDARRHRHQHRDRLLERASGGALLLDAPAPRRVSPPRCGGPAVRTRSPPAVRERPGRRCRAGHAPAASRSADRPPRSRRSCRSPPAGAEAAGRAAAGAR